jgi:hypothetical protein
MKGDSKMSKRMILSLTAVMFLLGAGSSYAASLSSSYLMNGATSKAKVISRFGEPIHIDKDTSGRDRYIFEKNGTRLEVSFENNVVWSSHRDSVN